MSVLTQTKNMLLIELEEGFDLQLCLDGLPESTTFRQTVIKLTKDIWESHLQPKIMTLVFWAETRHHLNCSAEKTLLERPLFRRPSGFLASAVQQKYLL